MINSQNEGKEKKKVVPSKEQPLLSLSSLSRDLYHPGFKKCKPLKFAKSLS